MTLSYRDLVKVEGGKLYWENGVYLGDVLQKEDGFYDFWPDRDVHRGGYWPAHMLRAIADKLDEMNKPWQDIIDNDPAIGGSSNANTR